MQSLTGGLKAVPFKEFGFSVPLKPCPSFEDIPSLSRVIGGFLCCPNSPIEKSNLDKSEAQTSLRDRVLTHPLNNLVFRLRLKSGPDTKRKSLGRGRAEPLLHLFMAHEAGLLKHWASSSKNDEVGDAADIKARG